LASILHNVSRYKDIKQFSFGKLKSRSTTTGPFSPGGSLPPKRSEKLYYISIHMEEVFKFFPFYSNEITKVVDMLAYYTGRKPYDEADYIKGILVCFSGGTTRLLKCIR
jgi:hypothetical protein